MEMLTLQAVAALVLPLVAAAYPVYAGCRITVRDAISSQGLGGTERGLLDRLLAQLRGLPRPMLLAIRNTVRRRGRLALTLLTLILGGSIFIAVLSVRDSLLATLDDAFGYRQYDVQLTFEHPQPRRQVEREALRVPGVLRAESWGSRPVYRVRDDGSESDAIVMTAPGRVGPAPADRARGTLDQSDRPGGSGAEQRPAEDEPDLRVGDSLRAQN